MDLDQPRDLTRILDDAFALLRAHLGLLLLLSAGVVVPVELIVSGIGLGQLTSGYDSSPPVEGTLLEAAVGFLVTTPLITAMVVNVVRDVAGGREPSARRAAQSALDVFAPLLGALLLVGAGVAAGFLALIVPGVILAVHWTAVAQVVVAEGQRGTAALARSWALVSGRAWWVLGVLLVTNLIAGIAGAIVAVPAEALAKALDAQAVTLGAAVVVETFTLALLALTGTLLYFSLASRSRAQLLMQ